MSKKSKYYREGYNNPIRCAETITKIPHKFENQKWVKEMSDGVKDALKDKQNGNYKFI